MEIAYEKFAIEKILIENFYSWELFFSSLDKW